MGDQSAARPARLLRAGARCFTAPAVGPGRHLTLWSRSHGLVAGARPRYVAGAPVPCSNRAVTKPGRDVVGADVRPVRGWALAWRVLASVALVLLLLNGSLRMHDDAWPFGPMSQYAFSPPEDDTIVITRVYGLRADGERVELPLRVETAGISRAEIEARIPEIQREPSLLRAVSDGWTARHPTAPGLRTVHLVQDRTHLQKGRVVSKDQVTLATWSVRS